MYMEKGNEIDRIEAVDAVVGPVNEMTVDSADPSSQSVQQLNNRQISKSIDSEIASHPGEFNSLSMSQEKKAIRRSAGGE